MQAHYNLPRLVLTATASVILLAIPVSAQAEESYQRVSVEELKRIQQRNDEEQQRLEATPEYQAKKRKEEQARKQREAEAYAAKQRELKLQMQAAELERKQIENQRLANQPSTSRGSSGGTGSVVVVRRVPNVPRIAVVPKVSISKKSVAIHPVVRVRR